MPDSSPPKKIHSDHGQHLDTPHSSKGRPNSTVLWGTSFIAAFWNSTTHAQVCYENAFSYRRVQKCSPFWSHFMNQSDCVRSKSSLKGSELVWISAPAHFEGAEQVVCQGDPFCGIASTHHSSPCGLETNTTHWPLQHFPWRTYRASK